MVIIDLDVEKKIIISIACLNVDPKAAYEGNLQTNLSKTTVT